MRWPRQYAADIMRERSRERRRAMLDEVPAEFRDWVEHYVRDWHEQRKNQRE